MEFVIVSPRAVGMGGLRHLSHYRFVSHRLNPGSLALTQTVDILVQASGQGIDRLGIRETLDDIDNINDNDISAGNQARLQNLLNDVNRASRSTLAAFGLYFNGQWENMPLVYLFRMWEPVVSLTQPL